jgi:hypothetical protein
MVRDFCFKLFGDSFFNTGISVTAFSIPHIVYLLLIVGGIVFGALKLKGKSVDAREKVLGILVYCLVISYIFDFFVHEFVYFEDDGIGGALLSGDKLPFHICTVMCPIIAFTHFNKHFKKFIEPVTMLAIVAPMMYISYPASIGSGEPWCYQAFQTMFFHGVELAWGILNIATGKVTPKFKNCWKSACLLILITLWAKLGNITVGNNWFFLQEDALYIGLVEMGILPQWTLMVINPTVFFMVVLMVYGVYYLILKLINKSKKTEIVDVAV